MKEKQALADVTGPRYRKAGKSRILDEFCQSTGYRRKYAIALLRNAGKTQLRRTGKNKTVKVRISARTRKKRAYKRFYDEPAEKASLPSGAFSVPSAANAWCP
jgi:hypothetical protein